MLAKLLKEAKMENKTPPYFAIDSDVLRTLTYIDITLKNNPQVDLRDSPNHLLKKWSGYFLNLYKKMKNDELRLVIVDAVYQESQHSISLLTFMKDYCYFPKINLVNYQKKAAEARKLANAYCSPYKVRDNEYPAPMKKVFNAANNSFSPTNDCFIMAQATIEGIPLITANGKDFIFDEKSGTIDHTRTRGITIINIAKGYSDQITFNTAKPLHIHTIGPMLKDKNLKINTMEPLNNFELGADLITEDDLKIEQ